MRALALFSATAAAEIFGSYAFYAIFRLGKSIWWGLPGAASLLLFAWLLTLHPTEGAGRIYAAYGGVYVAASVAWLWIVEKTTPDRWDLIGAAVCLLGTAIIYLGPRA